jgi:hypothetical protein
MEQFRRTIFYSAVMLSAGFAAAAHAQENYRAAPSRSGSRSRVIPWPRVPQHSIRARLAEKSQTRRSRFKPVQRGPNA